MNSRGHNRAICSGDQGRFGPERQSRGAILAKVSKWSANFIESFIPKAQSGLWRTVAQEVLESRLLPKTKKDPKRKRDKAPKTPGLRVPEPAQPAAALPEVGL